MTKSSSTRSVQIISTLGLFSMLFVTRIVINVTYSSDVLDVSNTWDYIISALLSMAVTAVMLVPIYFVNKNSHSLNFQDFVFTNFKKTYGVVFVVFALYFLYVCSYTFCLFSNFLNDLSNPQVNPLLISILLVVVCLYGATKGIQAIVRTSAIIFIFLILSFIFLFISLATQIDKLNFKPFFEDGFAPTANGLLTMVARNFALPVLVVLLPICKGNIKKGLSIWTVSVYAVIIIFIVVLTGALGDYIQYLKHPVLSGSAMGELGILKRLDVVYLGFWTAGMFVKISLYLYLFKEMVTAVFNSATGKTAMYLLGLLLVVLGVWANKSYYVSALWFNTFILCGFTVFIGLIMPLIFLLKTKRGVK